MWLIPLIPRENSLNSIIFVFFVALIVTGCNNFLSQDEYFDEHSVPYSSQSPKNAVKVSFSAPHLKSFLGLHGSIWATIYSQCLGDNDKNSIGYEGTVQLSSKPNINKTKTIYLDSQKTYFIKFGLDEGDNNCLVPFEFKPQFNKEYSFIYRTGRGLCAMDTSQYDNEIRFYHLSAAKNFPSKSVGGVLSGMIEDISSTNIGNDWRSCDYWNDRPNITLVNPIYRTRVSTAVPTFDFD